MILTLDYELFGNGSGCLDSCLRQPVDQCLAVASEVSATVALFVDAPEFLAFRQTRCYRAASARIEEQLGLAVMNGHAVQLHLHPQWLGADYQDHHWSLSMNKWRIGDLDKDTIDGLVVTGLAYLRTITGDDARHCNTFRAGGWAIQPAAQTLSVLAQRGILMDSTVAPGSYNPARGDWYDFRRAPLAAAWPVMDDICQVSAGDRAALMEVPIATHSIGRLAHISALFEQRRYPRLPDGCAGSYAGGVNSRRHRLYGKLAKLASLGHVMLDFSTMPAATLIEISRGWMDKFNKIDGPVPLVAIAHGKNFTPQSAENMMQWLQWLEAHDAVIFSSYHDWLCAYRECLAMTRPATTVVV